MMFDAIKEYFNLGIAGSIGAILAWLISQRKSLNEILKLKREILDIEVSLRKELFIIRNEYKDAAKKLLELLRELETQSEERKVKEKWNEVKEFLLLDFLTTFSKLLEISKILFKTSYDKYDIIDFIDDELFPFLETLEFLINKLNSPKYTDRYNINPIKLSKETYIFVVKFIKRNLPFYDFKRKRKLKDILSNLNSL